MKGKGKTYEKYMGVERRRKRLKRGRKVWRAREKMEEKRETQAVSDERRERRKSIVHVHARTCNSTQAGDSSAN